MLVILNKPPIPLDAAIPSVEPPAVLSLSRGDRRMIDRHAAVLGFMNPDVVTCWYLGKGAPQPEQSLLDAAARSKIVKRLDDVPERRSGAGYRRYAPTHRGARLMAASDAIRALAWASAAGEPVATPPATREAWRILLIALRDRHYPRAVAAMDRSGTYGNWIRGSRDHGSTGRAAAIVALISGTTFPSEGLDRCDDRKPEPYGPPVPPKLVEDDVMRGIARGMRDHHWSILEKMHRVGTLHVCPWNKSRTPETPDEVRMGMIEGIEFFAWVRRHPDWFKLGAFNHLRETQPMRLTRVGKAALRHRTAWDMEPVFGGLVEPGWMAYPLPPSPGTGKPRAMK